MTPFLRMLLENSVYSAMAAAVVLCARLALRRSPRSFSYVLWAAVFFRLLCPVQLDTGIGVIPELSSLERAVTARADAAFPAAVDGEGHAVHVSHSGQPAPAVIQSPGKPDGETVTDAKEPEGRSEDPAVIVLFTVWAAGTAVSLSVYAVSYLRLRRRVRTAVRVGGKGSGIYESDRIDTAFVLGIFRPRVYVPLSVGSGGADSGRMLLSHERTHIRRGDNIVKPLAYLTVCAYWFSPAAWLSYFLMCRDMEMSCDEAVINDFGDRHKGGYCKMLLDFGTDKRFSTAAAFGESSAERRIYHLLRYKRPSRLAAAASALAVMLSLTACVGTAELPRGEAGVSDTSVINKAVSAGDAEEERFSGNGDFPDLLASCSTVYNEANQARSSNLCLAGDYIDGAVVQPGEVFSFNKYVGKWTPERGFCKAATYPQEEFPEGEYGAGVIQTASTLYCCAVRANLEITQREPGKYLMPYMFSEQTDRDDAAYAKEATVMNIDGFGTEDMRFRNTKEHPIRITCTHRNGIITFELWGTWDGFTAEYRSAMREGDAVTDYQVIFRKYDEGKLQSGGQTGCSLRVYRVVYYQEKQGEGERLESERYLELCQTYQPLNKTVYVEQPPEGYEFDTWYSLSELPEELRDVDGVKYG